MSITELHSWRHKLRLGTEAYRGGDYERAEKILSDAFHLAPTELPICAALGRTKWRLAKYDDAQILLAWAAREKLPGAALDLTRMELERGNLDKAGEWAVTASADFGTTADLEIERARIFLRRGEIEAALVAAETAHTMSSDGSDVEATAARVLARALNHKGIKQCKRDKLHEAIFSFRRAQWLDATWSCPHVNMGAVFATLKKHNKARECYDKALVIDGSNAVAHYNLGLWHAERGNDSAARTCFARAVECDPDNADAWVQLGYCLEKGQPDKAKECWETALAIQPEHEEALRCLGKRKGATG